MSDQSSASTYQADVLVIGGGPAGTWAAISAARNGASVILADKGFCGTSGATAPSGTGVWYVDPDPAKRVLVAGTYNGHPVNAAAAIATLRILARDGGAIYADIAARAAQLQSGLEEIFAEAGITATIVRNASAFCAYFMAHAPVDWHDILEHHDFAFDRRYRAALIAEGIYQFPLAAKQGSVSAAHTGQDILDTLAATRKALAGCR